MQDKTSSHTPIPTELNIAPRGKSWLHGQLIDGEHGYPTRQSMENAESAQPNKTSATTATPVDRKDLVPGVMRCAKCEFQLVRQVLAVNLGEVFAGDSKTEPCPNDCGPLWPVTWKQYAEQAMDAAESMADRAFAAEKEVKQLRGEFTALDAPNLRAKIMSTPLGLYGTGIGDIGIAYRAGHRAALLTAADLVASTVVAAPAAVAMPAEVMGLLEALESMVDVCEGHDFDGAPSDAHMEKARAAISTYRAALAATPAAAPVVPAEPDAVLRVVVDGDTPSVISFNTLTNGEYGVFYASTVRALLATATGLPAQAVELPTVELIGIKDGKETSLGQVPMPPTMKARELLRDVGFSGLDDDDGDGAYAMGACEQLIEYCQSYYSHQARADARDAQWLQAVDMAALERFDETADDDQSYDIGKDAVTRLARFGCLQNHGFGQYSITAFGNYVLNNWSLARELPFKMQSERDAEHRAAVTAVKGE